MKRINFNLLELQAFVAVAEHLSFRAASEELNISAPAFSRRISQLESLLGTRLLDRSTRKVTLTNVGRVFLMHARAALNELEGAIMGITDLASHRSGLVTVGCVSSATYYFLPTVLKKFTEQYPRIRIRVIDDQANKVLNSVVDGVADFGLNFTGTQEPDIDFRPILREAFVLAVPKNHPFAKRAKVRWDELHGERFMSTAKTTGNRLLQDYALGSSAKRPAAFFEAEHVSTLLGMVEAGVGVAAVPRIAIPETSHPNLVGVPLVKPVVSRCLGLISCRSRPLSPAAKMLYDMLAASGKIPPPKKSHK
jgi:DNA-binding transcriptional LysR family regulator